MLESIRFREMLWMCAVAMLFCAFPRSAPAQVLQGQLIDSETRDPVALATIVMLADDTVSVDAATTDSAGYFRVAARAAGEYRLLARRIGYPATISAALRVGNGDTLRVEFRISAGAVLLDPVEVTGRRRPPPPDIAAFYDRADRAIFGTFITREEIEAARVFRTSDLLRRVPGVQIGGARFGAAAVRIRGCDPILVVDGVIARSVRSIDTIVTPLDLEGLEIYRSPAQVPPQYGGLRGDCGAILIWTRRGP